MGDNNYVLIQFLHTERNYAEVVPKSWLFETTIIGVYQVKYPIPQFDQVSLQLLQHMIHSNSSPELAWEYFDVVALVEGNIN